MLTTSRNLEKIDDAARFRARSPRCEAEPCSCNYKVEIPKPSREAEAVESRPRGFSFAASALRPRFCRFGFAAWWLQLRGFGFANSASRLGLCGFGFGFIISASRLRLRGFYFSVLISRTWLLRILRDFGDTASFCGFSSAVSPTRLRHFKFCFLSAAPSLRLHDFDFAALASRLWLWGYSFAAAALRIYLCGFDFTASALRSGFSALALGLQLRGFGIVAADLRLRLRLRSFGYMPSA